MTKIHIFRFFLIIGVAIYLTSGGSVFSIQNGYMTLELDPFALLSFPLFAFFMWFSMRLEPAVTEVAAPWWRGFAAFLTDFIAIMSLIGIPLCFFGLVVENSGFPQEWQVSRQLSSSETVWYSFILLPSILIMIGMLSLALHPKIVSPGAFLTGIEISTQKRRTNFMLATFGFLSYFMVAFPFMKHFIFSQKERRNLEPKVVLRNA